MLIAYYITEDYITKPWRVCVWSVIRHQAGKAELKLTIVGPRGNSLPFTMNATALGEHVVYTPRERGPHLIYVTYGGLDVTGSSKRRALSAIGAWASTHFRYWGVSSPFVVPFASLPSWLCSSYCRGSNAFMDPCKSNIGVSGPL